MAYTDTEVYLLNVPLDSENNHTYYFESAEQQFDFFKTKVIDSKSNLSYQRKDNAIRYPAQYDNICACNYVMYRNLSYSNKVYYAFVKELIYKDDGLTDIVIETDPIQTYLFDYSVGKCFVEREHVKDDTIGLHTIPEQLETGEYVGNGYKYDLDMIMFAYVVNFTDSPDGFIGATDTINLGGIPVAGGAMAFLDFDNIEKLIDLYTDAGKLDAIQSIYMVPKKFLAVEWGELDAYEMAFGMMYSTSSPVTYEFVIDKPETLDGYLPRNKKLFTAPYQYLILSNNAGNTNIFQFEHFKNPLFETTEKCYFEVTGIPVMGGSIKSTPKYYKNMVRNEDEGIMAGKFPVLSWSGDYYTNWLTQNSVNISVSAVSSLASVVGGIAMIATGAGAGVGAGMIGGGLFGIAKQMGQIHEQSFTPPSAKGNANGGDVVTANQNNTFYYINMCIKNEYAKIIDNYFDQFGYKINELKIPNSNHRTKYWYTKTHEANITGAIPNNELQKIKNCYNKGITFWRHTASFRNYELNNFPI